MAAGDLDIHVTYTLKWGGSIWLSDLRKSAKLAVMKAITIYYWELYHTLNAHWGSVSIFRNLRKTIAHSSAGSPPFVQTQNLGNSLNVISGARAITLNQGTIQLSNEIQVASVYSDVPYAKDLEFGGMAAPYDARKLKYTDWRLINPIRHSMYIAPRPAWRPSFDKSVSRMIGMITVTMQSVMKRTYIK